MSRNIGHVIFQRDNVTAYFIYNGTVEQCYPKLYVSLENANKAFIEGTFLDDDPSCFCGEEEVVLIVPYVECGRIQWKGTACRKCMCIRSGLQNPEYY